MPYTRSSKRHTVFPNGFSEEEIDSSHSAEDEMNKIKRNLALKLQINEKSSSSEESEIEETKQLGPPTKEKKMHWKK
jgi:hypothetical protein